MEIYSLILMFIVSIFVGLYSSLIGGGALSIVPLLIFMGFPPQAAIGTSKLGSIGTTLAGTYNFAKHRLIDYKIGVNMIIVLTIGTIIGANIVIKMNEQIVKKIISIFILIMLSVILANNRIGTHKKRIKKNTNSWIVASILTFLIGIYAGFFGGGYGTLLSYVLLFIFGQTFLESAATRKIPGLASNITAMIIFSINGLVNFTFGIIIFIGTFIGSFIATHHAPKIGNEWIRRGFVVIVIIMAIKLLIG